MISTLHPYISNSKLLLGGMLILEHRIEVEKGVSLFVNDIGKGEPVILLHGWPLNQKMYEYQMNVLPSWGFRAIAIDFRGYGKSDAPYEGYDYSTMADDVRKVIDKLKLKNSVLAGFSMGGAIAIRYMARHKAHRISKLMLFGAAAPAFVKSTEWPFGRTTFEVESMLHETNNNRPLMIEGLLKNFFYQKLDQPFHRWFQSIALQAAGYATAFSLKALRDEVLFHDLNKITVPTAIFHGKHDRICPFDFAKTMHKKIQSSKLISFEQSGHGLFFEELDKFNHELKKFISQ